MIEMIYDLIEGKRIIYIWHFVDSQPPQDGEVSSANEQRQSERDWGVQVIELPLELNSMAILFLE